MASRPGAEVAIRLDETPEAGPSRGNDALVEARPGLVPAVAGGLGTGVLRAGA
ncbi:hypothetical protein [Acuticoccus sediminis]|uniref:hypothetical protein n=1 Tax=Acuticoccus sediminis TaxID=2184697 RepID=UPI0013918DDC|nr:hypothetical protein [Acuticoccus sediminis]